MKTRSLSRLSPTLGAGAGFLGILAVALLPAGPAASYPPAVGITAKARDCLVCHVDNGPWKAGDKLIIDLLDKATGQSLQQPDGSFLITAKRGERKAVVTVIGAVPQSGVARPNRNAWLFVDPRRIPDDSLMSKFAPGWEVDLPMSCRLVGDKSDKYPGADVTVLPLTVRPGDSAQDADIELQAMLTRGESVKGKPAEGLIGSYFVRTVRLRIVQN